MKKKYLKQRIFSVALFSLAVLSMAGPAAGLLSPEQLARPLPGRAPSTPEKQASTLTAGLKNYSAIFKDDLFVDEKGISLRGVAAGMTINFIRPRGWQIQAGSQIRLLLDHSPALIPELSYLNIAVNDRVLQTIKLDESNVKTTVISIPMPPELLADFNQLQLSVAQHYTRDCEDPFHSSLWTNVGAASEVYFEYNQTPQQPDLQTYPAPFFDELHYGPTKLQYMLPEGGSLSQQSLLAMATTNASLAQAVAWHRMETAFISSLDQALYPVIIVGTPSEQPMIGQLSADQPIGAGAQIRVMQNPSNPLIPVLIVSGGSGDDVLRAARALAQTEFRKGLNGQSQSVTSIPNVTPAVNHEWPGYIPNKREKTLFWESDKTFTLTDLGYKDQVARGFFSPQLVMNFRSVPDYRFIDRNLTMTLRYSYSAQLDTRLSVVEVRIDDTVVRSLPLNDVHGQNRLEAKFQLPASLIHPNAKLRVKFYLYPIDYDPCKRIEDAQISGTLHADTSLDLPRDLYIYLPDLQALRNGGYPLTLYQDMQDDLIALPASPTQAELQIMLDLTSRLGRMSKANNISLDLATGSVPADKLKTKNIVSIGSPDRQPLLAELAQKKLTTFRLLGGNQKALGIEGDPKLQASDFEFQGVMEEVVSPWNAQKVVLAITGRDEKAMLNIGEVLRSDQRMSGLTGNLILAKSDGSYNAINVGDRSLVGYVPWWRDWQLRAAHYWWQTTLLTVIALIIIFAIFRGVLSRYRGRSRDEAAIPFGA